MAKKLFIKLQTPTIELPVKAKDASGQVGEILVGFKRYDLSQLEEKYKESSTIETSLDADIKFMLNEVIYIKNAKLEVYEDDKYVEDFIVEDTRSVEPNEFFQDPKEALAVLLGYYLNSVPWKNALFTAYQTGLFNTSSDDELKNS